jgi:pimeloyl-ACP methyl ester carboxylesterase
MQIVVDSLLTHYEQTGKGKQSVVLLHGWGDALSTFKDLQKFLSEKYTVVSVDLPGFGTTQAPTKIWDLDDYAQFVAAFLKKINLKPYAIIAHSNGGALAIRGLATKTLQADKFVAIASSGIRDQQKARRAMLKVVAKGGKVATFWLPTKHKQKLRKALYGVSGSDMLVVPHLQETFKKTVRQDVQSDAAKLEMPVLLIYGEKDKATPPIYGRIFHELMKNSTLEVVGGAEHFVFHDKPQLVDDLIGDFLYV